MSYFRSALEGVNCFTGCASGAVDGAQNGQQYRRFGGRGRTNGRASSLLCRSHTFHNHHADLQHHLLTESPSTTFDSRISTTSSSSSSASAGDENASESFWYLKSTSLSPLFVDSGHFFGSVLRMRNGNFIEFNVDNENDDESCSIISSANVQQQLMSTSSTTDFSLDHQSTRSPPSHRNNSSFLSPSRQQYSNSISTSANTTNNNQPARNQRPASIVSDFSLQQQQPYWWQQPSNLVSRITPPTMITNSSSGLPSSSSPLLPKRNKVPANTTTNSSHSTTSSGVQMGSGSTPNSLSGTSSPLNSRSGGSNSVTVHWPVGNSTEISITSSSTAFDLIGHFLTSQLYTKAALPSLSGQQRPSSPPLTSPANTRYLHCYALRMVRLNNAKDDQWLHPGTNMATFLEQQNREQSWKLELRIRYLPFSLQALAEEDPVSFKFLYDQVLQGFLLLEEEELLLKLGPKYQDLIVELGTLELRRSSPYLTPAGLEKSSNFEALEGELGRFLPAAFIASVKSKQLRKLIKGKFKKIFALQPRTAMFEFLRIVHQLVPYTREVFRVSLGDSAWSVSIDLMVGADSGMAYHTAGSTSSPPTVIVKSFELIEQISIVSHATMNRSSTADRRKSRQLEGIDEVDVGSNSPLKKILLNIRIAGEEDTLVISCASFAVAQSLADLIDGYHRLATNCRTSVWVNCNATSASSDSDSLKLGSGHYSLKSNASEIIEPRRAEVEFITPPFPTTHYSSIANDKQKKLPQIEKQPKPDQLQLKSNNNDYEADYSSPMEMCTEICRSKLTIEQLIGTGQFGDVHKGLYYPPPVESNSAVSISSQPKEAEPLSVAVKISKMQTPGSLQSNTSGFHSSAFDYYSADQKLLCEAERMQQLEHANIIKLIGVCSASPVYVVMELATYGELRDFLAKHGPSGGIEHRHLLAYSMQIASALAYLESMQFVHRDIAARNILVFSFELVKLADFGLSRYIEDASYYMATNSKLPIKWMSPESINFRRFTTASDVWMFAVCVWEIFMLGRKPFQGVKNADVIGLIEGGERLAKPPRCPPALYTLLLKCWKYEPDRRPSFRYVKRTIREVAQTELGLVGAIARIDVNGGGQSSSPMSSLSSISGNSGSASSSLSRNYALNNRKTENSALSGSSLNASQVLDAQKIKAILSEQRKQMEADSKWLAENELHWQTTTGGTFTKKNTTKASNCQFDSLNSRCSTKSNSSSVEEDEENLLLHNSGTATSSSVYEDADCGGASALGGGVIKDHLTVGSPRLHRGSNQQSTQSLNSTAANNLYSVPNNVGGKQQKRISYGDESYNSFKSTTSLMATTNTNTNSSCDSNPAGLVQTHHTPSTSSSVDSIAGGGTTGSATGTDQNCGLSVSLKKFFKHNQLTDNKMRQEMMQQVNMYSSGRLDRTDDAVYRSTIEVTNAVRQLLKGVQELNTSEYVDLVKNVGQELRNLLANVDSLLVELPQESHWTIAVAQKKLTADMNDLVEAMKRTIMHSDTPMEEAYKQGMLETTYVLVIDSKNLLDTVDEVRLTTFEQVKSKLEEESASYRQLTDDDEQTDTTTEPSSNATALEVVKRVPLTVVSSVFSDSKTETITTTDEKDDQVVYENTTTKTASD